MNVKTVYLETSVLGSVAPRQPADRKRIVKELLAMLDGKRGVPVISAVVVEEVEAAPPAVAESIRQALAPVQPHIHPITEAVRVLAPLTWRPASCLSAGWPMPCTSRPRLAMATIMWLAGIIGI